MENYKTRKIKFKEIVEIDTWQVKVYTISKSGAFNHPLFYKSVISQLPSWFQQENSFDATNDKMAFLILHAGTEGIFSLINWWVGKNMLNTHIFMTNPEKPNEFEKISGDGLAPCIWELEIINHERISWIKNVLKQIPNPHFKEYLNDTISIEL